MLRDVPTVKVSHWPQVPCMRRAGAPVMIEREGHRVFNPGWLFVLEMAAAGFTFMARHELVARQYLLVFAVRTGAPG